MKLFEKLFFKNIIYTHTHVFVLICKVLISTSLLRPKTVIWSNDVNCLYFKAFARVYECRTKAMTSTISAVGYSIFLEPNQGPTV